MMLRSSAQLRHAVLLLVATSVLAACVKDSSATPRRVGRRAAAATWSPATLESVQGVPIADIKGALAQRLAGKAPEGVDEDAWKHTQTLYKAYGQTPLWLTTDGLARSRARELTDAVLGISDDALRPEVYPVVELGNALLAARGDKPTADELAHVDVLLSAMYASLGEDLLVGQIPPKGIGQAWFIDVKEDDVDSALVRTLGDTLSLGIAAMRPEDEEYGALQKELARYRDIVAKGDWPLIPAGKTLKPGQSDSPARIAALRERLAAEGITVGSPAAAPAGDSGQAAAAAAPAATGSGVYDAALAEAVGVFQTRHSITVDGNLSPETVKSLNVPAAYRLGQVAANLERFRWMPRDLGDRYIFVNVPAFQLTAFDSGQKSLEMKVIVGQEFEDRATPVFSDSMETVVFRPYWNVTPDIQRKEIEPKGAAYMASQNMEYFTDGGQRRIRQRPGPTNSLGFVKFLFPNDYNIYLHDTPNHELFKKDVRAFSHGCIRLEKPNELAQWVLGWDAARVQAEMDGKDNVTHRLPRKLPVYITYGTAFMRDGQLHFGNDLYHRDDKLVQAAAAGAIYSENARKNLETLKQIASAS